MITIDATNKTLGRVASEAAKVILGKHKTSFVKHAIVGEEVTVTHAAKIKVSGTKRTTAMPRRSAARSWGCSLKTACRRSASSF
jgi:large subunit ribosomal protein L13